MDPRKRNGYCRIRPGDPRGPPIRLAPGGGGSGAAGLGTAPGFRHIPMPRGPQSLLPPPNIFIGFGMFFMGLNPLPLSERPRSSRSSGP